MNAVIIGYETDQPRRLEWDKAEQVLLICFAIELTLRIWVLSPKRFFDSHHPDFVWNLFDVGIVFMGFADMILQVVIGSDAMEDYPTVFRMIRLLRILRIFRLIRFLKRLYILAYGFTLAAVAVFWVACLLTGALYFCAIILVRTLGHLPEEEA